MKGPLIQASPDITWWGPRRRLGAAYGRQRWIIYLHVESGGSHGARFNLGWLLKKSVKNGDGELPKCLAE